ncbi:MAG: hypothetical protein ACXWR4_07960 [Bdellovibrionota bacterium]
MKPNAISPAALAAAVLLCGFAHAADDSSNSMQQLLKDQQACKRMAATDPAMIYSDEHKKLKTDYDPDLNCSSNAGDETVSYNSAAVDQVTDLAKLRLPFAREAHGPYFLRSLGACKLAYLGVRDVFESLSQARDDYCDSSSTALQTAKDCGAAADKKCEAEWTAWREIQKSYVKTLYEKGPAAIQYLTALRIAAGDAKDSYQKDLDKLDPVFSHPAKNAPTDSLPDAPAVKAANGNKATQQSNSLSDYYALLNGVGGASALTKVVANARVPSGITRQAGPLISEEDVAAANVKKFGEAFMKILHDSRVKATSIDQWVGSQLDKNGANGKPDSAIKKVSKYAPTISETAPLAQGLLKDKSGNGNGESGASPAAAESGHEPIAEAAAVAGLGALAAKGFSSSKEGTSSSPEAPATAAPPAGGKGEVANFADHTEAAAHAADHPAGTPSSPLAGAAKPEASAKVEAEGGGGFSGGGTEGSSRMLAGKKIPGTASALPATGSVEMGGAGTGDLGASFTQNLEPKPRPSSAAAANPGSEVANLLGQMKNLFNFDESPAPGGAPGAPLPGGSLGGAEAANGPTAGGELQPALPPDAAPDAGETAVAENPANPAVQADQLHGSPFGRSDTTLFDRVHLRHHRCMERGMVMYGLKERVE